MSEGSAGDPVPAGAGIPSAHPADGCDSPWYHGQGSPVHNENQMSGSTMDSADNGPVVLLAIHPEHAEAILAGRKTVELRRTPIRRRFQYVALYATAPVKGIVGLCRVHAVVSGSPTRLWCEFGKACGITRRVFRDYFSGCQEAHALVISDTMRYDLPLPLAGVNSGIRPPQSFLYLPVNSFEAQRPLSSKHGWESLDREGDEDQLRRGRQS